MSFKNRLPQVLPGLRNLKMIGHTSVLASIALASFGCSNVEPTETTSVAEASQAYVEQTGLGTAYTYTTNTGVPASPMGYIKCSDEWGACSGVVNRHIAYGANGTFAFRDDLGQQMCGDFPCQTQDFGCNNSVFGDPIPGPVKACYFSPYAYSATEYGQFTVTGTKRSVAFGINNSFVYKTLPAGTYSCTASTFGGVDPAIGWTKSCLQGAVEYANFRADEGGTFRTTTRDTPVAYGADGYFFYKVVTGTVSCDSATFGDPAPGHQKACYSMEAQYGRVAGEGGSYSFGTPSCASGFCFDDHWVAYGDGVNGAFTFKSGGSGNCDNAAGDPSPTIGKSCWGGDNGVLTIYGTEGNDNIIVRSPANGTITVWADSVTSTYPAASIRAITFYGMAGNDAFKNYTALPVVAHGGDGDDVLVSGTGDDVLYGDAGRNLLQGAAGKDVLYGGPGPDYLSGGDGDDTIYGMAGDDILIGGQGVDLMNGGTGDDQMIGYELNSPSSDTLIGDAGANSFWVDSSDVRREPAGTVTNSTINRVPSSVASFSLPSTTQASVVRFDARTVDPNRLIPTFSSLGPVADDVLQGSLGDCYFLSGLGALAKAKPSFIRDTVADLGDGTYLVRNYNSDGTTHFMRTDANFWSTDSATPIFAKLSGNANATWATLVEKTFAQFKGSYEGIDGGSKGAGYEVWLTGKALLPSVSRPVDRDQIISWDQRGRPTITAADSALAASLKSNAIALMREVKGYLDNHVPLVSGGFGDLSDTAAINVDHYRRGAHIFMPSSITTDVSGTPTAIVLRNPYGSYVTLRDHARIMFFLGGVTMYQLP